ncbi:peptidyl-prolyl cis-trans isomerase H, putative [Entamoeba invadens IP1]|uniref:Peptidyl-prolyl cis-trans isomerase n=1 Tax=Entamoeba invadens IP1 TaxID=370355 RepID=A0A0A1UFS0_ENTIV|nr:peptidyl-prolyl cis-trans isomerase H, putative [Entamoeba invadens IP1]ELP92915.1 peptidyl-prolyl cis-trans isomerase H, putative [Entamoeba invadens IP1]|eukprot:XP_004259686.1 peptidyl-prolyl cis-trans isomerase H, putative [Entamoeba invadens IP1]
MNCTDPLTDPENPIVFFDISVGDKVIGRVKMELFRTVCPKTVENFRQMCTGDFVTNGKVVGYKDCVFHRVIKNAVIQSGDVLGMGGSGQISIYGDKFDDENFKMTHDVPGLLSMVNSGPNTNGSQFMITCSSLHELDGKNVVFGQVTEGMKVVRMIENVAVDQNFIPKVQCTISQCGQY